MTSPESIELCNLIGKLWPAPRVNHEQLLALQPRLKDLPIDIGQAKTAVNEEFLNPSADKVPVLARIWRRLQGIAKPRREGGGEWRAPNTAAEVLLARMGPHAAGWTPLQAMQSVILADQARYRERHGESYAKDHAWRQWTIWRADLADAGMALDAATFWLVANTEVEQAWVDAMEAAYAKGRARQRARLERMRDDFAPSMPTARKQPGFYVRGEPQIGAV